MPEVTIKTLKNGWSVEYKNELYCFCEWDTLVTFLKEHLEWEMPF